MRTTTGNLDRLEGRTGDESEEASSVRVGMSRDDLCRWRAGHKVSSGAGEARGLQLDLRKVV